MKVTFTRAAEHFGTTYRAGDVLEVNEDGVRRLVQAGVARIAADELTRYLHGRRLRTPGTTTSMQLHRGR